MPSGAEYKEKHWLTKTKPVVVKELLRLIVVNAKSLKLTRALTRKLSNVQLQRNVLDNQLILLRDRFEEQRVQLNEAQALLNFRNQEIMILQRNKILGVTEKVELMHNQLILLFKPKPTRWQRFKSRFTAKPTLPDGLFKPPQAPEPDLVDLI